MREIAIAVNAGTNPGKDGENITKIKPALTGEPETESTVKWWPDEAD
jgi:hypothetical protein